MTKVKICGVMTEEDCEIMNCFKPDYVGFVFANTRHKVDDKQAAKLRNLINKDIPTVGVFVDEPIEHVSDLYTSGIINVIQLHGSENQEYIDKLKEDIKNKRVDKKNTNVQDFESEIPIIKAARVKDGSEIKPVEDMTCEMMLLDNYDKSTPGGTGKRFDLTLIPKTKKPYFLAGGLNADNVRDALIESNPYAVDISTGVETDGHKDWKKVEKLMLVMEQFR